MYDKYFQATPITIGSKIPKHKGILFSGGTAGTPSFNVSMATSPGGTFSAALSVNQSPYIFPFQVLTIPSTLPTGMTAYYIN